MQFETKTVYTLTQLHKGYREITFGPVLRVISTILLIVIILQGLLNMMVGRVVAGIFMLLVPFFMAGVVEIRMCLDYLKDRKKQNLIVHFTFHGDSFDVINEFGSSSHIKYSDLYKIRETKDNFYPMPSRRLFYIIEKKNCSESLIEFLHDMSEAVNKKKHADIT